MNKKPILMVVVVLLIISTICGTYGLMLSKKHLAGTPLPEIIKPKASFEYYLDEELVSIMPSKTDEEENTYAFSNYVCENNMTLSFDEENWTYSVQNESNGVCKLYFIKTNYIVELTVTNGLVNGEEASYTANVQKDSDEQFNIIPNEGYEFDGNITCSNEKEALFDVSTNMLTINSITENVACKIDFNKKQLKLEVVVKNGTGSTTEDKEYGESVSAIVQPKDGYEKPKITCTNKQEYTYEDNKLTIAKLTNNTVCTVTFKKTPAVMYNLIIKTLPEQVVITYGNKKQTIEAGKDGKFTLKADEGYSIILDCDGVKPSSEKQEPDGATTYTFLGMRKNITCNVSAKYNEQITDEGNGY